MKPKNKKTQYLLLIKLLQMKLAENKKAHLL